MNAISRKTAGALTLALAVFATGCSSGLPSEYSLIEEPYVAPPRTDRECDFGYASQLALVDRLDGTLRSTAEIPHRGHMAVDDDVIVVGYGPIAQPSGVLGFDTDLQIRWQGEFPGHMVRTGREQPPRLLEPGKALLWGKSQVTTNIIVISTDTGEQLVRGEVDDIFTPPVLADGVLVTANADDEAHGIDAATGQTVWTRQLDSEYAGNAVAAGGNVYLPGWNGSLLVLDSAGEVVGQYETSLDHVSHVLTVLFGTAIATGRMEGGDGGFIVSLDLGTGSENWRTPYSQFELGVEQVGAAVAFGGQDQGVQALEVATGNVLWRFFGASATALVQDSSDAVFYVAVRRDDDVHLLAAISGREVLDWEIELPGIPTVLSVVDDLVMVGGYPPGWHADNPQADSQGWLAAYSPVDGSILWSTALREAPRQVEAIGDDLIVATADPVFFCD